MNGLEEVYDFNRYNGIKSALERAKAFPLSSRYKTAADFYAAVSQYFICIPQWKLDLSLNETLCQDGFGKFAKWLRIPYSGSIPIADEVEKIIDTAEFQRLRGVRQLGPAMFVFPGANHTRYEHSIGTYFLSLRYLQSLLTWPQFRETCHNIDETIKLTVLSALLHDIGHYPYSHWIEEIDQFHNEKGEVSTLQKHETRARSIIGSGNLRDLIEKRWKVSTEIIANIIAGEHVDTPTHKLISSIIESPLDLDKLDYLVRDSIHCGVDYGKGIDVKRLLHSFCVTPQDAKLCITDKGMSCLLALLTCRNIMYREVYWHKTVRACDAMFKRFLYEYIRKGIDTIENLNDYFKRSDDHFVATLLERVTDPKHQKLANLLLPFAYQGRNLYKPAYIYYAGEVTEDKYTDVGKFFSKFTGTDPYNRLVHASEAGAEELKRYFSSIEPLDILLEQTPVREYREKWKMRSVMIWNIRKGTLSNYPGELLNLDDYLSNNMRTYLFCSPQYYEELSDLTKTPHFAEILGRCQA